MKTSNWFVAVMVALSVGVPSCGFAQEGVGGSTTIERASDDRQQVEAAVVRLQELPRAKETTKLYGTAGGDPAINGLYTYIAVWEGTNDGWRVFLIGDFNDWKVISHNAETLVLQVSKSDLNEAGDVVTQNQRLRIGMPSPDSDAIKVTRIR
jgi:hypothetical protein